MKCSAAILALSVLLMAHPTVADVLWATIGFHPVIEMDGVYREAVWFDVSGTAIPTLAELGAMLVGLTAVASMANRNRAPGGELRCSQRPMQLNESVFYAPREAFAGECF